MERLHVVEGTDWKDALIALLDDRSPYRPWRYGFGEAHQDDPVALVLDTEPPSIMTALGKVAGDGRPDRAIFYWPIDSPGLLDLATLSVLVDVGEDLRTVWQLRGDAALRIQLALTEYRAVQGLSMRTGHSSVVAARILLHSKGRCSGCDFGIDLTGVGARDAFHIHTVDEPTRETPQVLIKDERGACSYRDGPIPESWLVKDLEKDWPGVLCHTCHARMEDEGYTSLVDFRFSRNPKCPRCWAERTQCIMTGMPATPASYRDVPPWIDRQGCVNTGQIWTCAACAYEWQ